MFHRMGLFLMHVEISMETNERSNILDKRERNKDYFLNYNILGPMKIQRHQGVNIVGQSICMNRYRKNNNHESLT